MKTLFVIGILLVGISGQAFSMGHPHNMFAARKQMRSKASTSVAKSKTNLSVCWHQAVQETKTAFSEHLLAALTHLRPTQAY